MRDVGELDGGMMREIVDAQLELVCRFRGDGTILFANQAYAQSLGQRPEDLVGRSLWNFVTAEDREHVAGQMDTLTPRASALTIENRVETKDGPRWMLWRNHALEFDSDGRWSVAQSAGIDITERKQLEERLELLVGELNHRVKNTLMVVQAMAHQTFRGSDVPADLLAVFTDRLAALGAAHTALSHVNWSGASLETIIRQGLVVAGGAQARIKCAGPELLVRADRTVPVVMVVHELATNAIKHGALSNDSGTVGITWARSECGTRVILRWQEQGGPEVVGPGKAGFGTRLITDAVTRQLDGTIDLAYRPEGVTATLSCGCQGREAP